jgi:hypothetical protein
MGEYLTEALPRRRFLLWNAMKLKQPMFARTEAVAVSVRPSKARSVTIHTYLPNGTLRAARCARACRVAGYGLIALSNANRLPFAFRGRDIWATFAGRFRRSRVHLHRNVAAKRAHYEARKCTL